MGVVRVALPNKTDHELDPENSATNEEPLLSGSGRDFLAGRIDAEEYVERLDALLLLPHGAISTVMLSNNGSALEGSWKPYCYWRQPPMPLSAS